MNILLIEPDRDLGLTVSKWLDSEGWKTQVVHNSQNALDQLDKNTYDLIVLELVMPGSNGVEFLQEVRSYPDWHDIPCIVYTRANLGDLELPDSVMDDLNIHKVLHKSKDTLADLSSEIKALDK